MVAISLTALAAAFGASWGAALGLIRDQNAPNWTGDKPAFSGWKECGIATIGAPLALLWLGTKGVTTTETLSAAAIWLGMGAAWSMGHAGGLGLRFAPSRTGLSVPMSYAAMAGTGALVTLVPAAVLAVHGALVLAAVVLLAGAAKVAVYEAAYVVRGLGDERPHAGTVGAMAHGAVAYAVAAAAMVGG